MTVAFGLAIGFGSFLVGLFMGCIIKLSGAEIMIEQMQEKCKRCIVLGELKNIKGEPKHE